MRKTFLSILFILPLAVSAQTPAPAPSPQRVASAVPESAIPVDRVVAVVGGQVILWSDVMSSINQQRAAGLQLPPDSAGQAALARDALNALVDEEILVQKAHLMKVEVTPDEVNRSVDDQVRRVRQGFQTDEEFRLEHPRNIGGRCTSSSIVARFSSACSKSCARLR